MELALRDVMLPGSSALEKIRGDYGQDSLPLMAGLYEAFLAKGATGRDALLCYLHLLWTYRKQGTDRPWAVSNYLAVGLKLSPKRVRLAKGLLCRMRLIEYIRDRGKGGRLSKVYTKLNLMSNPGTTSAIGAPVENPSNSSKSTTGAVSPCMVPPPDGPVQQMLEERKKCLKRATSTSLAPEEKPKNRVKDKASKEASNSLFPFMASFLELYKTNTGREAKPTGKEWGQLKDSVDRWGREDWLERIALLGTERVPRSVTEWLDSNGWKFGHVLSQLFKLDAVIAKERQRLRLLKTCKACRKASETTGIDCPKCGEPEAYQVKETSCAAK